MNRGGSKRTKAGAPPPGPLWPARAVEIWPIERFQYRPGNPKDHTLEQIEQIVASIKRWGFVMPVLVDEQGVLIAGHGRIRAARLMGLKEAPVLIARGWTEDEIRAYAIADNKIPENAEWNEKALRAELKQLVAADFDMGLIGFSAEDLNKMILDPAELKPIGEPQDVHLKRCPTCGSLKRQIEAKK